MFTNPTILALESDARRLDVTRGMPRFADIPAGKAAFSWRSIVNLHYRMRRTRAAGIEGNAGPSLVAIVRP